MESSLAREADFALKQYQYDKFTVQSALLPYMDFEMTVVVTGEDSEDWNQSVTWWEGSPDSPLISGEAQDAGKWSVKMAPKVHIEESAEMLFASLAAEISLPSAFYAKDKTPLYSGIEGMDDSFLDSLSEGSHTYQFRDTPEGSFVLVGSVLERSGFGLGDETRDGEQDGTQGAEQDSAAAGERIYFVTQWDISKTVRQQEILQQYFLRCYLAAITAGMALLGLLSAVLTDPLKRMSRAARRMAQGDYEQRLAISGRDEIGELAESFNQMAGAVEEKVEELSQAARQKEDFVANFAHEMKTPMTSIIGYADMLYQKELPRKEARDAAWYIWNEGMRLEALSLKLMDLTVLGRQEFPLQEMAADELLRDVSEGLGPLFAEKEIRFELRAEPAYVRVEYDLLKTLLINLMDNSMKAGCGRLELSGERAEDGKYRICVRDDGCGMEEGELARIKEAFYMVDKARSRKQHGAGLGLALADRIARIHGSELEFRSGMGKGTEVSLCLPCVKERTEDEE